MWPSTQPASHEHWQVMRRQALAWGVSPFTTFPHFHADNGARIISAKWQASFPSFLFQRRREWEFSESSTITQTLIVADTLGVRGCLRFTLIVKCKHWRDSNYLRHKRILYLRGRDWLCWNAPCEMQNCSSWRHPKKTDVGGRKFHQYRTFTKTLQMVDDVGRGGWLG